MPRLLTPCAQSRNQGQENGIGKARRAPPRSFIRSFRSEMSRCRQREVMRDNAAFAACGRHRGRSSRGRQPAGTPVEIFTLLDVSRTLSAVRLLLQPPQHLDRRAAVDLEPGPLLEIGDRGLALGADMPVRVAAYVVAAPLE